jgi:Spy/CpxP family protein refolding chaperone
MKRKKDFWVLGLGLILAMALAAPSPGLANEKGEGSQFTVQRAELVKELNLAPDKAKAFLVVGEKYDQRRSELFERVKKNDGELEKALAAPQPDAGKIKELVAAITQDHDRLLETFKAQRQEEMALLTPVEQGKFIMALKKWHTEKREKSK